MTYKELSKGILRSIGIILIAVLSVYFLWLIRSVIAYIFIAFALSLMGRPLMNFLTTKLKFSTVLASITTLIVFILLFSGLFILVIPLITEQAENLSLLNLEELEKNIEIQIIELDKSLENRGLDLISLSDFKNSLSSFNISNISGFFENIISFISNFLIGLISVLFITFFFLKDSNLFKKMIVSSVPDKDESKILGVINNSSSLLSKYFLGLALQVLIMFSIYLIILLSFGIENKFIIAFLCALLNLIPYLGPLMGALVFSILSMSSMYAEGLDMQMQILPNLFWIMVCYLIAQLIDNFISQPLIYSKSVKSHPLEIFIIMLIAGILFGLIGIIFAVPGYTVLRFILKTYFSNFKLVQSITKDI